MNTPAPVEVLIRSTDAIRDSWLYVNWLDNPGHDTYRNIPAAVLNQIQTRLASALMVAQSGETEEQAARRALTTGPFATRDGERDLATYLSSVLLPDTFWHQLANHTHNEVLVRITPSRRLAHVPWELLTLPDGTRLIEHVTITYEVASTIHYHRDPLPTPWEDFHDRPGLATIDPAVHELTNTFRPTLSGPERAHLCTGLGLTDHGPYIDRLALATGLQQRPSSWIYFGHVSLRKDQPGSAAFHLYDGTRRDRIEDGTTRIRPYAGAAELIDDVHRPLTALDLVLGTSNTTYRDPDQRYVHPDTVPGHQVWPMPPRVGLIACESGGDHASSEAFGLVTATLGNGAEYVTATRWTMPTSTAFTTHTPGTTSPYPTSDFTINIHHALTSPDPTRAIRTWQLDQLHTWEGTTNSHATTPLLFAGIATYHAPPRQPDGSRKPHPTPPAGRPES